MAYKKSCEETALSYLAHRMRTEHEVRSHLGMKGFALEEIASVIEDLKARRYIDDYEYAREYVAYGYSRKHAGRRILRELVEKGVSAETAGYAHEDYLYENSTSEYELAREQAFRLLNNARADGREIDADKLKARIGRNLAGRGFGSGDIYRIFDEIDEELRG